MKAKRHGRWERISAPALRAGAFREGTSALSTAAQGRGALQGCPKQAQRAGCGWRGLPGRKRGPGPPSLASEPHSPVLHARPTSAAVTDLRAATPRPCPGGVTRTIQALLSLGEGCGRGRLKPWPSSAPAPTPRTQEAR